MASRRERRAQREATKPRGRSTKRQRAGGDDDIADMEYWRQLRGQAQ